MRLLPEQVLSIQQLTFGGPNAWTTVEDSVAGMMELIDSTNLDNTGRFVDYCGNDIPW
ncbi:hypothetical protein [Paraferrimonas sedimenticola]|uniref:Uncharacterized protein n=1 Tax=Paraferrimonas sedimenticola TaxID=375674 RepID=A0AA37VT78_9GAMM|nr:hypothetical protein [Paraferrimonas sedimenticola]GLP95229.1 hypothetical protein GCM10007895_05350 [Paraferrimonas sedimenticola]